MENRPASTAGDPGQQTQTTTTAKRAALLLDVENLFGARNRAFVKEHKKTYNVTQLAADLETLTKWMDSNLRGTQFVVKRGYADFHKKFEIEGPGTPKVNGATPVGSALARAGISADRAASNASSSSVIKVPGWHLEHAPEELMSLGIEPIQVYSLAGQKNAVDLRIAMDASLCVAPPAPAELVILVAGDSDYVPVVLQLRRLGTKVWVIGFRGSQGRAATGGYLRKFAGRFKFLEDLLEKGPAELSKKAQQEQQANVPHSVVYYKAILKGLEPSFVLVPREDWIRVTDEIFRLMGTDVVTPNDLVYAVRPGAGAEASEISGAARAVVGQLLDSDCLIPVEGSALSAELGPWDRHVKLAPGLPSLEAMRMRARETIVRALAERLDRLSDLRPPQTQALVEMFCGPNAKPGEIQEVEQLVKKVRPSRSG
jgi:uncharacterized LabA/DUF88 family protein